MTSEKKPPFESEVRFFNLVGETSETLFWRLFFAFFSGFQVNRKLAEAGTSTEASSYREVMLGLRPGKGKE